MLKVQEYLKSGKTLDNLKEELGIRLTYHSTLPLVILNYHQLESPKTHPIIRECRSLTLNLNDYTLISRSLFRFFNWGEVLEEADKFNWNSCSAQAKEDGSLVKFYFFDNEWHVSTRGSFADCPIFSDQYDAKRHNLPVEFSWKDGILRALGVKSLKELNLDPKLSYTCEFCSLWNKVVREYKVPKVYLISCFCGEEEIGPRETLCFQTLEEFSLNSADDILNFVNTQPEETFEGVVAKDCNFNRWKLKNDRWKSLSRMKGNNGDNIFSPKNLLPYVLKDEGNKVLKHFPEVEGFYYEMKSKIESEYKTLESLYSENKNKESQKEFALSIVGKSPLSGILFNTRKNKGELRDEWLKSGDYILKALFKR